MILNYLEELRHGPIEARKRFAVIVSTALTLIIIAVWLTTLLAGTGGSYAQPTTPETTQAPDTPGIFEQLSASAHALLLSTGVTTETEEVNEPVPYDFEPRFTNNFSPTPEEQDEATPTTTETTEETPVTTPTPTPNTETPTKKTPTEPSTSPPVTEPADDMHFIESVLEEMNQ